MYHLSKKWTLKSLAIEQHRETNTRFWEDALKDLPPLPRVGNVTIIYHSPTTTTHSRDFWQYFDQLLARRDLFPALESVKVRPSIRSQRFGIYRWLAIYSSLRGIRSRGTMPSTLLAFE